jgi:hypothetical protein
MHSVFTPSWSHSFRKHLRSFLLGFGVTGLLLASGAILDRDGHYALLALRSLCTPVLDASSVKSIDESRRRMEAGMTPAEAEQFKSDIACVAISSGIGPGLQGIEGDALIVESFKSIDGLDAPEIHRRAEAVRANVGGFFRNLAE